MFKSSKYTETVIHADKMLQDFGNDFLVISVRPYKGKAEKGLAPGATFTLQVMQDNSAPIIDQETGEEKENNQYEQFEVTVPGLPYPCDIKRRDHVSLGGFMPEASYFINFSLILRFKEIKKLLPKKANGGHGAA